jgi:hypothetical protein
VYSGKNSRIATTTGWDTLLDCLKPSPSPDWVSLRQSCPKRIASNDRRTVRGLEASAHNSHHRLICKSEARFKNFPSLPCMHASWREEKCMRSPASSSGLLCPPFLLVHAEASLASLIHSPSHKHVQRSATQSITHFPPSQGPLNQMKTATTKSEGG